MDLIFTPEVITAITGVIVALCGALVAIFTTIKQKQSVKKANAYAEEARATLEAEKLHLQQVIIKGSYVICPKCGDHVTLENAEVHLKEVQ